MWQIAVAPVRGHLPAAARLVVARSDAREKHRERRDAEREAQRAIAVVRVEPVVAGAKRQAGRDEDGFVARAADLEIDEALILELDLLVVDAPRQQHRPVDPDEIVVCEVVVGLGADGRRRETLRHGGPQGGQRTGLHSIQIPYQSDHLLAVPAPAQPLDYTPLNFACPASICAGGTSSHSKKSPKWLRAKSSPADPRR